MGSVQFHSCEFRYLLWVNLAFYVATVCGFGSANQHSYVQEDWVTRRDVLYHSCSVPGDNTIGHEFNVKKSALDTEQQHMQN